MMNTNRSKSSRLKTASEAKCRSGALESWSISEKMTSDRRELEWIGRGFNSRIAFWTITRFAQERAHSRNTRFSLSLPELEIEPFNHLLVSPDSCLRGELVLSLHALQTGRGSGIEFPRLSTQGLRSRPPD